MAETQEFKKWHKLECARLLGSSASVQVDTERKAKSYNFRDNRVVDHVRKEKSHNLQDVLDGKF